MIDKDIFSKLLKEAFKNFMGDKNVEWEKSNKYDENTSNQEWVDPGEKFEESWKKAENSVDQDLADATLNIAVIGTVNSGKSSFIKAITENDDIRISPVAGETTEICKYVWPGKDKIYLTDTPGLEDINQLISAKATDFVESEADVVLYFVNAAVGVTGDIKKAFLNIKSLQKPVVTILSKIDALDVEDLKIALEDCNKKLGLTEELEKAISISTRKGADALGIEDVTARVTHILKTNGKTILWGRMCKNKAPQAERIINWGAGKAFAVGALPLPGSDVVLLTGIQFEMIYQLAKLYGKEINKEFIKNIILQLGISGVGKQIYRALIKGFSYFLGPAGVATTSAIAAATAGSMTYGLGHTFKKVYAVDVPPAIDELIKTFQDSAKEYGSKYEK